MKNIFIILGDCITSVFPGDVCALNSMAADCIVGRATRCDCREGYEPSNQITCVGKTLLIFFKLKEELVIHHAS